MGDAFSFTGFRLSRAGDGFSLTGFHLSRAGDAFPLAGFHFSRVGDAFSLTGFHFSRVGDAFSLTGFHFSRVGDGFPLAGFRFSRVGDAFSLTGFRFSRDDERRSSFEELRSVKGNGTERGRHHPVYKLSSMVSFGLSQNAKLFSEAFNHSRYSAIPRSSLLIYKYKRSVLFFL
jgi:hypothetical protein